MYINPPHEVRDQDKLENIVAAMEQNGWQGRPLLVIERGNNGYQALTGSHRIAAAEIAGIEPEIYEINEPLLTDDEPEIMEAWQTLAEAMDDEEVLGALQVLNNLGQIENRALELMTQEFEKIEN